MKFWNELSPHFFEIYNQSTSKLVDLNLALIHFIRDYLDVKTPIIRSSELSGVEGYKDEKIISICKSLGAETYLSGIGVKSYTIDEVYQYNHIKVVFQQFDHPIYPQRWGKFVPNLSIVDLLFNCGPNAKKYITKQIIV